MHRGQLPVAAAALALCALISTLHAETVRSGSLEMRINVDGERLTHLELYDAISKRTIQMPEAFVLERRAGAALRSSQMTMRPLPESQGVADPHESLRGADSMSPAAGRDCWLFTQQGESAQVVWCVLTRPNADYLRTLLGISAGSTDLDLSAAHLIGFTDSSARVEGSVNGSPIVDGNLYFGFEHPLSESSVTNGMASSSLHRELPLRAGQTIVYSGVMGTAQAGQLRRAFSTYLEAERPRPYAPFLHYNSWYDIGYGNDYDERAALDRVRTFAEQLTIKRGVQLSSYLFDDGWDDPNTLWQFNSGFPDGFTRVGQAAEKYGAGVGVWLSPWGGYEEKKEKRLAYGRAHGYGILNGGYALSDPKYYAAFEQTCLRMIDQYHVNQFKFDGTGNVDRVYPGSAFDSDFSAAIHLIERLRRESPALFINLTTGTTASPFWLFYADSIWRGGEDHDFDGVGSDRQRWITYRDEQTYRNIVRRGPLFPLNSLMLHGLIYASRAHNLGSDPRHDFSDEVHSYFASGTQLQEMYITPSLLTDADWNLIAEGARWSQAHKATLEDSHWVGGDPGKLQIYGWAAWTPLEALITLRNPSTSPQRYTLQLDGALELPANSPPLYRIETAWGNTRKMPRQIRGNSPLRLTLAPFEVLTLILTPQL